MTRLAFGYPDYKGKQKEVVEAAVRGADILVIAPTGMGKVSICFSTRLETDIVSVRVSVSRFRPSQTRWAIQCLIRR